MFIYKQVIYSIDICKLRSEKTLIIPKKKLILRKCYNILLQDTNGKKPLVVVVVVVVVVVSVYLGVLCVIIYSEDTRLTWIGGYL
jgi:hypothetical protein